MCAETVQLSVIQHNDAVGILNGGDPLCDNQLGRVRNLREKSATDLGIGSGVHRAGAVV